MFMYNGREIKVGKSWRDDNGVRHPRNWNIWSAEEKEVVGIVEIEIKEETPPDSRLYRWSRNSDGTINKKPKDLVKLKESLTEKVKTTQGSLLSQTDWTIVRKVDTGTEVPVNIQTWRDAIRTRATEMENAIDSATDTDAVSRLFVSWDDEAEDNSMDKFREAAKVVYDNNEANSLSKFKEAAAKTLKITIPTEEEIAAFTPEQKTAYDGDQEKITTEAESKRAIDAEEKINAEATSKREAAKKKYPILYTWPELEEEE